MHDLWISADMTENNLGHIDVGDEAAIVLDVLPGEVLKGRVRSIGRGVDSGQPSPPGSLPTVQNNRDWLRQAQRIPGVDRVRCRRSPRLEGARVGGQAEVLVYAGDNPLMNLLGAIYIRVVELAVLPLLRQRHEPGRQGDTATGDRARPGRVSSRTGWRCRSRSSSA